MIRECPSSAWKCSELILPIIIQLTRVRAKPSENSEEASKLQYAAVSGTEVISGEIDVRVSMIALLESLLRAGSLDWTCSSFISESSLTIIKDIILPNLIWRVGKVEATIRKVALVATHSLLKAGSVNREILFSVASELVPAVVTNLDDQEAIPRQICCFCLDILFTRLRYHLY